MVIFALWLHLTSFLSLAIPALLIQILIILFKYQGNGWGKARRLLPGIKLEKGFIYLVQPDVGQNSQGNHRHCSGDFQETFSEIARGM